MLNIFSKSRRDPRERIEPTIANSVDVVMSSDNEGMRRLFADIPSDSGAVVNDVTAMKVSVVYACVRLLAGAIATLPLDFYQYGDDDTRKAAPDHDYWWLFNEQACSLFTSAAATEYMVAQVLLRGDGIAYLNRASRFSPTIKEVIPVARDKVQIVRVGSRLRYTISDTLADGTEGYFTVDQDDVLHFPNFGFNGVCSPSTIRTGAYQAIGIALRADEHAARTFGSGASIQYAVKAPGKMTLSQQELFREAWVAKYGSGVGHSKIPLVLTEGLDVTELSMTAADAQLLESRRFQVADIARAFGLPPHMVGDVSGSTSWGSGIESMGAGFVRYALRPHLRRFQQELNRKLFPRIARYFVEYNTDALIAGDAKAQGEYYGKALGGPGNRGWMTQNEVRKEKNLPPLPGGDKLFDPAAANAVAKSENTDNESSDDESPVEDAGA
jgi:HK97 family phage portal protein